MTARLERSRGQSPAVGLIYLLPLLFLGLFFFYPLFEIFRLSLAPQGRLDLSPFWTLVRDPYYWRLLAFTV